ncbi:MurR/RpiR family transcriptional regulator [Falsirhodobacter xinxiangensis]|uniref:MurR/RpiR family transcriptional regulator n=1 Tax=Falsirhodobacter xinxiangensis TaxID=2530049 RepID=UPI001C7007D8|nr:MurR/RpiR family transcriptional regulator [Rhodobacter xinxiangensis]
MMDGMSGRMVARIQAQSDALTPSETRLVSELMRVPREIALVTSAEFAGRVGVHEATTSRLARKLGFSGYAAFRDALRQEYVQRSEPADRLSLTLEAAEGDHLAHLVASEMAALASVSDHVTDHAIAEAAALLHGRRVFVFAHGHATSLADMAERRMRRMGIDTRSLRGNARDLAEQALPMRAGDALLAFAFRRQPQGYAPLLRLADEVGAATLTISDTVGAQLRPAPQLLLAAPRSGVAGGFQTLTVPMVVTNALILALGAAGQGAAMEPLDRLGSLIENFENSFAR